MYPKSNENTASDFVMFLDKYYSSFPRGYNYMYDLLCLGGHESYEMSMALGARP